MSSVARRIRRMSAKTKSPNAPGIALHAEEHVRLWSSTPDRLAEVPGMHVHVRKSSAVSANAEMTYEEALAAARALDAGPATPKTHADLFYAMNAAMAHRTAVYNSTAPMEAEKAAARTAFMVARAALLAHERSLVPAVPPVPTSIATTSGVEVDICGNHQTAGNRLAVGCTPSARQTLDTGGRSGHWQIHRGLQPGRLLSPSAAHGRMARAAAVQATC